MLLVAASLLAMLNTRLSPAEDVQVRSGRSAGAETSITYSFRCGKNSSVLTFRLQTGRRFVPTSVYVAGDRDSASLTRITEMLSTFGPVDNIVGTCGSRDNLRVDFVRTYPASSSIGWSPPNRW